MKKNYTVPPLPTAFFCLLFLLPATGISRTFGGPGDPTNPDSLRAMGHLSCIIIADTNCATQTLTLEAWIVYSFSGQAEPVTVDWTTGVTAHKIIVPAPGGWGWDTTPFTCEHNHNSNTFETFSGFFPGGLDILGSTAICPFSELELTVNTQGYNEFSNFEWSPANDDLTPITVDQPGVYSLTVTDAFGCVHSDQVTVTQIPPFVPQITGQNQICPTGDTTVLTVQGPYSNFQWNSGDVGSPIIVTEPGNYEVTATDVHGCTGVGFFGVQSNGVDAFPVTMTSATLCPGQLDTLSVLGGFSQYHWSNGASGINNIVNQGGTYTVTVTNFAGCTGTGTVTVTGIVPPDIQISSTPLCPGGTALLTALSDTLPHYHWSTNQDTSSITISNTGTYSVTVSGSGICATSTSIVVNLAAVPTSIIDPPDLLTCSSTQFPLEGSSSSSGPNFPFTWSTQGGNFVSGDTTLTPIINQPGIYILSIVNSTTGCIAQDTVTVGQNILPPGADPGPPATLTCANPTLSIGPVPSPADTLLLPVWSTSNGTILSGDSTWAPVIGQPGTYTLVVTNVANGCSSTATLSFGQDITPPVAQIATPNMLTCTQSTVALDGSGSSVGPNFSYQWSTSNGTLNGSSNNVSATAASVGDYTLLVTNTTNGCTTSTTTTVAADVNIPVVSALPPNLLTCTVQSVLIDASGSSNGPGYEYTWTTGTGTIVSGGNTLNPVVSAPGTYTLSLLNTANACSATLGVQVLQDIQAPVAVAGTTNTLSCSVSSLQLDGAGSSFGADYIYQWSTTNGSILNGSMTLTPTVSLAGEYVLQVTDTSNGCTATSSTLVQNDVNAPQAIIAPPAILTCTVTQINIDASASTQNGNQAYVWSGPGIVSGQGTLQLGANMPGNYTLQVTNNLNGCTDVASILVSQDIVPPTAQAGSDIIINCSTPTGSLGSASNPSGSGFTLLWSTSDGNFSSAIDGPTVGIDQSGTYQLLVVNNQNGCTDTDEVVVQADFAPPLAEAGPTTELTCVATNTVLIGAGSSGPGFNIMWTTTNGNIVNGANSLSPLVDAAGDYNLLITNTQNGCTASDMVTITESADLPVALAGQPQMLTCIFTSATLDGSGSSAGPEFAYSWSTTTGNISSGANTLMPIVDAPGVYIVTVTNTSNNCTKVASVTITQDIQNPVVDAGLDNTLTCAITSLPLAAQILSSSSSGISYAWGTVGGQINAGGTTANPTIGAAGTYIVTVTDAANGCTGTDQLVIGSDMAPPIAQIGNPQTLTCTTTQIPLSTAGSSTGPNFSYDWTTQGGNIISVQDPQQPLVDAPGTYLVLITNTSNGCTQTASVVVPEDVQLPTVEAGSTVGLDCDTQTNVLNGNGSSTGAAFTYAWTTGNGQIISGNTTLTPSIGDPGTYTLLVTNTTNGCTQTDNVLVTEDITPPTFGIASPAVLTCTVLSVPLNASGTNFGTAPSFTWSTTNGNILNGANTLNASVNQPGNYSLLVLNTVNGCSTSAPVVVTQDITPPTIQIQPPPLLTCTVLQFPLQGTASPQTTVSWSTTNGNIVSGANTLGPIVDQPGLYQVVATSTVNGCTSTSQLPVLRETNVPTGVLFDLSQPLCNGTPGVLSISQVNGGVGPYGYSIDGGQHFFTFQEFDDLEPGSFNLVVQDINGCEISQPITVIPPLQPLVTLPPQFSIHLGANQELKALIPPPFPIGLIQQVIWEPMDGLTFGGSSILDLLHPTVTPFTTTEYTVTIVTEEGCTSSARSTIKVDRLVDIYAPNIIWPEDPDGDNGTFQLFARDESVAKIHKLQVFDRWGTLVFENGGFSPNDLSSGWDGMYKGQIVDPAVFVWWAEVELVDGRRLLMKGDVTVMR